MQRSPLASSSTGRKHSNSEEVWLKPVSISMLINDIPKNYEDFSPIINQLSLTIKHHVVTLLAKSAVPLRAAEI